MKKNIRLISAGAGTGKTSRLTEELSDLLTGDVLYKPSEIIATTFTKAAAGELKSRISKKLLEAGALELAAQLDQALVGTVNSISQQLLTLFSFEAGISPNLSVIEDDEKDIMFRESLKKSLDESTWNEIDEITGRFSMKREDAVYTIRSISDYARNNDLKATHLEISRDESVRSLEAILPDANEDEAKILKDISKRVPGLSAAVKANKDTTDKTGKAITRFENFYYKIRNHLEIPWAEWATCEKVEISKISERAGLFEDLQTAMGKHLHLPSFQNDLKRYIQICFDGAIISMDAYAKLKSERGLIDFVDQESLLLHALDDPRIRERFQEQFKVLFVDEFQDTSPLQLFLFLKISSLVEKVIWVGDAKQAIFGFRSSDAQLINTITSALGEPHDNDILPTSYRSRPQLVKMVNQLFLPAFQNSETKLNEEQIVLDANREDNAKLSIPFHLWGFQWKYSNGLKQNEAMYHSHVASRIASFIDEGHLTEEKETKVIRKIRAGDIAVLCRTNNNCNSVANALRDQGLQAVVADAGLNQTGECRLLRACLHLLVDKNDSLSKSEIKFLSDPDHDIEAILQDRIEYLEKANGDYETLNKWLSEEPIVKWINQQQENLLSKSISGIIQLIYSGLDFHNKVVAWGNGAQRHVNLQQILSYANEFEEYCAKLALLPNVHGFISWFDQLSENKDDKRGLVTNELSVNVMTYHMAKGREWPVVILYDMDYYREPNLFAVRVVAKDKIDFDNPLKGRSLRYWPWPYQTNYGNQNGFEPFRDSCKSTPDYLSIELSQKSESLRLLYVGFTRARDYVILPFKLGDQANYLKQLVDNGIGSIAELGNGPIDKIIPSKLIDQPLRLWMTEYNNFEEGKTSSKTKAAIYLQKSIREYLPYHITPSSVTPAEDVTFTEGFDIHTPFSDHKIEVERSEFGTFIHRVFCAYNPAMKDSQVKDFISRLAVCYGINSSKIQEELLFRLREFYKWIETEFKPIKIYKELPLMMESNGQLVDGIADMVVETADEVILIDYKTFTGDKAAMQFKAKEFTGQLKFYMDILRKGFLGKKVKGGIYFVMRGVMVWVK
jgi:ATP-dependent exoDNAse (exonuclease V) beta subunit